MFAIVFILLSLALCVYAVFDLHDSVVILKLHTPEGKVSRSAELAYNTVERFKR